MDRVPAHQIAYARLRDMVLFGDLAPGTAVTIEGLVGALGLGMTPVREAIRRLIAERALVMQGNRRVSVPRLDLRGLQDLGYARRKIETELARQALRTCDDALISAMRVIDGRLDAAITAGEIPTYLRENHGFHFTLYARAGSEVLEGVASALWLRFGPSLRVVCLGRRGRGGVGADHHRQMLAALDAGQEAALVAALCDDIAQGVANIRAGLAEGLYA